MPNRSAILLGLSAFVALAGCQDRDFLNYNHEKGRMPVLECRCPEGFTMNPAADGCTREWKADPTGGNDGAEITVGDDDDAYLINRLFFADADRSTAWPFSLIPWEHAIDANGDAVPEVDQEVTPFWVNRVRYSDRISIKSGQRNVWHTKTVCINIQDEKRYTFFAGGDNNWNLKIDGFDYAKCDQSYCFKDGRFLGQTLKSGKHLVEMKYYDEGYRGALWYEIYDQPMASVQTAAQESDLNVLFSTKSLVGQRWDYSGEICPPGYAYDVCANDHKCTKLEKMGCL